MIDVPEYKLIPIEQLIEPVMPVRFAMDDAKMRSLVDSVLALGILQPLIVVPQSVPEVSPTLTQTAATQEALSAAVPCYEIVAGHRRYKAAVTAALAVVPCMVFADKDFAMHAARLAENAEREDNTPAEEAAYYAELLETFDYTEEQLLATVRQNADYVYRRLALLKGHRAIFDAVASRQIVLGVAVELNRVDDEAHARYLLSLAIEGGATIRTVNQWANDYKLRGPAPVANLEPLRAAGEAAAATPTAPPCVLCGSAQYPANIKWVPIHDFELDRIKENIAAAAQLPPGIAGDAGAAAGQEA